MICIHKRKRCTRVEVICFGFQDGSVAQPELDPTAPGCLCWAHAGSSHVGRRRGWGKTAWGAGTQRAGQSTVHYLNDVLCTHSTTSHDSGVVWPSSHLANTILNFISSLQGNLSANVSHIAQVWFYELVPLCCRSKGSLSTLTSCVGSSFPHCFCKLFDKTTVYVWTSVLHKWSGRRIYRSSVRSEQFLKYRVLILGRVRKWDQAHVQPFNCRVMRNK